MPEEIPRLGTAENPAVLSESGSLASLRNVGRAALADFAVLDIRTVPQLAQQEPDHLYLALCRKTRQRHDPCVHDVFAASGPAAFLLMTRPPPSAETHGPLSSLPA